MIIIFYHGINMPLQGTAKNMIKLPQKTKSIALQLYHLRNKTHIVIP